MKTKPHANENLHLANQIILSVYCDQSDRQKP